MKIFHGITNIAGIGGHLAKYQRSRGHDSKFYVLLPNPFFDNHDEALSNRGDGRLKRLLVRFPFFLRTIFRYQVFNFYFGRTLLPFNFDLPILRLFNKKIIMTYCGSEVRLASLERSRNPFWSEFEAEFEHTLNNSKNDHRKRLMMRFQGLMCHRVLAPRELYDTVATCIPRNKICKDIWIHNLSASENIVALDLAPSKKNRSKILIVHIPSSPIIKGTKYFRQAIESLSGMGYAIEYRELVGLPHNDALTNIAEADIVLDQLLVGGFGSLSVEAMALGKPVVCYLINTVQKEHYPNSPIVSANIKNIEPVLKDLIERAEYREDLGARGRKYFKENFSYELVNEKLLELYRQISD